jgi:peptidoglycan/LPS O-acetylase OafA/YrhL
VKTQWRSLPLLKPLIVLGRCSYEIYLTHMFVVFVAFRLFLAAGKPMAGIPLLFLSVVIVAGVLGAAVAGVYSEPVNRWLRRRWRVGYRAGDGDSF